MNLLIIYQNHIRQLPAKKIKTTSHVQCAIKFTQETFAEGGKIKSTKYNIGSQKSKDQPKRICMVSPLNL